MNLRTEYKSKITIKVEYAGRQREACRYNFTKHYSESMRLYRLIREMLTSLSKLEERQDER